MACEGPIEPDLLRADPLARFCLEDMTPVQRENLQRDLDLTQRLQSTLLPQPRLSTGQWEAASHYEAAGAVSGDCLDLVPGEDRSLFFLRLVVGHAAAGGDVEFGCAGHPPPVLVRGGDATILAGGGLPLGMFFATAYETRTVQVPDDLVGVGRHDEYSQVKAVPPARAT